MSCINLTFTQCKQLVENGVDLRNFVNTIENQPDFIKHMGTIDSLEEIKNIQECGCESGAYMPAVTYHIALDTMNEHGNEVLDLLCFHLGELPSPPDICSWAGLAVFFVSSAVELWCHQFDLYGIDC